MAAALLLLSLCGGLSSSQSLVELARKEKERREKLKGKKTKVVTNADLRKIKIRPAVAIRENMLPEPAPVEPSPQVTFSQEPEKSETLADQKEDGLKERWEKTQEEASLLSTQLDALWKQYHSAGNTVPKEYLQQQISMTYLQLQKAQQEADELKRQLDEAAEKKKEQDLLKKS